MGSINGSACFCICGDKGDALSCSFRVSKRAESDHAHGSDWSVGRPLNSVLNSTACVSVCFLLSCIFFQVLEALRKDTGVRHNILRAGSFQGRVRTAGSFISRTRSRTSSVDGDDSDLEGHPGRSRMDSAVEDDGHWENLLMKPVEKPSVKWELADSQKVLSCLREKTDSASDV